MALVPENLHSAISPAVASLIAATSVRSQRAAPTRSMTRAEDGEEPSSSSEAERQIRSLALGRSAATQQSTSQHGEDGARSDQDLQASVSSPPRHPNSEGQLLSRSLPALDPSSSKNVRITMMEAMSTALQSYSADALMAVLTAVEDLASATAPLEARKASLLMLQATAGHSGLHAADRARLFIFITAFTNSSLVESQVKALKALTHHGALLEPMIAPLVAYLHQTLMPQHHAAVEARRRAKLLTTSNGRRERTLEEAGLLALLDFTGDVISNHPDAITGSELQLVVESLIFIAEKTSSPRDMKKAASVIHSIITLSRIPEVKLANCIELLCGITGGIKELADLAWESLMALAQSKDGCQVVPTLLDIIDSRRGGNTYASLGALKLLKCLFCNDGEDNMPALTFDSLMMAIDKAYATHEKIQRECLRTIATILEDERYSQRILNEDWSKMMTVVLAAVEPSDQRSRTGSPDPTRLRPSSSSTDLLYAGDAIDDSSTKIGDHLKKELRRISMAFVRLWTKMNPNQQHSAAVLFFTLAIKVRLSLEAESLALMLQHLADNKLSIPGIPPWEVLQEHLIDNFLLDRQQNSMVRALVLELIGQAIPTSPEQDECEALRKSPEALFPQLRDETDSTVIAAFAELLLTYLTHLTIDEFSHAMSACIKTLTTLSTTADEPTKPSEAFSTQCTSVLVKLLIIDVQSSARRATILYEALVAVARHDTFPATRMVALKLLIRLRCDQAHSIFILESPDTLGLASAVSRDQMPATTWTDSSYGRNSMYEEHMNPRTGRTSIMSAGSNTMTRASLRSAGRPDRSSRSVAVPPLWMYPGTPGLPIPPSPTPSRVTYQHTPTMNEEQSFRLSLWLEAIIHELQSGSDWEIYSYIVVHLPSQLSNPSLFSNSSPGIKLLRNVLVSQIHNGKFFEPPASSGVRKGDVAYCLYHTLIMLLGYADLFARGEQDDLVRALLVGMTSWDRTNKLCIHGLALSCHIIPGSITRYALPILQKMAQIITQSHLVVDILEFLGGLARLPDIYTNFGENDYRTVFAICIRYLELSREKRLQLGGVDEGANYTSNRSSIVSNTSLNSSATLHGANHSPPPSIADTSANVDVHRDLPQYVYALAYHVLTVWFLSLKLLDRPQHVGWITQNLLWRNESGHEIMEEQSQVVLDMMYRTTYLDLGETAAITHFQLSDGKVLRKNWLVGLSIVTVETAARSGLTQLIKRQASGTTYAMYQQSTTPLPAHHVAPTRGTVSSMYGDESQINILPNHVFLQLSSNIAPTPTPMEAICLPDDEATKRAINFFDQNDTVDGYKIGVIYLAPGQTDELDILANASGSEAFESFLRGLGTKVELRDATFNTQGLDRRSDEDGTHTYAWRDRIVEIVYHVPTMMPTNLERDPRCINKKRHIGNDYVNIIFNESGQPFKFDTFPSEYNFINIVITPEALHSEDDTFSGDDATNVPADESASAAHAFAHTRRYTIQTQRQSSLPVISPAATYKLVALSRLPSLTRHLALNAAVFANVWSKRAGGEHISSWRSRLRAIARLRDQHANKGASTSAKYPGVRGSKDYKDGDDFAGVVAMGGLAENDGVLGSLDFSRWAGPNPPLV